MATNFPTSVDNLTNPNPGSSLNSPSHSDMHSTVNDAVEAMESYLISGAGATGLVKLIPTSVTGGTISANGTVSFTTAAVTVNGVFNSTYDSYKIILTNIKFTGTNDLMKFALNGITGSVYRSGMIFQNANTYASQINGYSGATYWVLNYGGNLGTQVEIDISGINSTETKLATSKFSCHDTTVDYAIGGTGFGVLTSTTIPTGFNVVPYTSGWNGGKIMIYGLKA